ncbi:MAG: bifunctional riboflavin kinase/FAD synthetase [Pseudomonadota bacterium]|nr:bifunctional riboflavin kinase/FAD synthetase [Pseudomonadota bacterium]
MEVVRAWRGLPEAERGAAVAIGNFDGVHRGHAHVIAAAAGAARALAIPLGAAVFDPHPRRWFQPQAQAFRLTTDAQRERALAALGVERLYALPFEAEMASMTDEAFAERVLAEGLGVRHVSAGFDFSFGAGRTGDGDLLRAYGERFGFGVSIVEPVADEEGLKLSSTSVRLALEAGRPEQAAAVLGRPFAIEGRVVEGAKLGRSLGFPTANVPLGDYVRPRFGVYATRTRLPDGRILEGVSSIGTNPTVGGTEARLEAWLFGFDEDLYGQVVETELIAFLRPEERFDSLKALSAQVMADAELARRLLAARFDPAAPSATSRP